MLCRGLASFSIMLCSTFFFSAVALGQAGQTLGSPSSGSSSDKGTPEAPKKGGSTGTGMGTPKPQSTWETPVGSDKFMNLRFSPIGLALNYYNLDVDFKMTEEWTLGPTVSYFAMDFDSTLFVDNKIKVRSYAVGARANWYKDGVFEDGMYVSPIVQYISGKASGTSKATGRNIEATASVFALTGLIGYHWFWGMFNLNLGAGFAVAAGGSKAKVDDGSTQTEVDATRSGLALDFMLGFAF